jgi:Arc/MetJ-type ribon-helix-helix transcriptional regulator
VLVPKPLLGVARRTLRLPDELNAHITQTAKDRGFSSAAAFIRSAVTDALAQHQTETALASMEERLAVSIQRQFQKLNKGQQAGIALIDALAQLLVSCLPEPGQAAPDRAKDRHQHFLKSAAAGLRGALVKALEEIE